MEKNKIILSFRISGFDDIKHDDITKKIGVQPVKTHVKGEKRNPNNPNSPPIKTNGWIMEPAIDEYASFSDQMDALLDIIEPKIDIFKKLSQDYYCEFICAIFVYYDNGESTPWVHLGSRYNKLLREVNIEFDLDLYVWPSDVEN